MRSFTPALIVILAGFALVIGAGVAWESSAPERGVHHDQRLATVTIPPANTEPVPVSFPSTWLSERSHAALPRGGQAT